MSKGFILWLVGSHQKVLSRGVMKSDLGLREIGLRSDSWEGTDWKWKVGMRFLQEPGWEMVIAETVGIEKRG